MHDALAVSTVVGPCASVRFGARVPPNGGSVKVRWSAVRTRINVTISNLAGTILRTEILTGPGFSSPFNRLPILGRPKHTDLQLPPGNVTVSLRKLTSATPFSMGVGRMLAPSTMRFQGLIADRVEIFPIARATRSVAFIGASDSAGYCVGGTSANSGLDDTLFGWKYADCDGAFPAELGRRLRADISVQALEGVGLVRATAARRTPHSTCARISCRRPQTTACHHPSPTTASSGRECLAVVGGRAFWPHARNIKAAAVPN